VKIASISGVEFFVTKDGSTIRELHHTRVQSLAEATLEPDEATQRHYHRASEEIYFVFDGEGEMELDGERRRVGVGDAIAIPPGAWHELRAGGDRPLRILCCCAPPYRHEDTFFE